MSMSMEVQTGIKRKGPWALIQDQDALLRVSHFDYVISDEFVGYCKGRGINPCDMHGNIHPGLIDHSIDFDQYYAQNGVTSIYGHDINHKASVYAKVMKIHRAKIQDCWELYLAQ